MMRGIDFTISSMLLACLMGIAGASQERFNLLSSISEPQASSAFGTVVKISEKSDRVAVGDPDFSNGDGAIFLYHRASCTVGSADNGAGNGTNSDSDFVTSCDWKLIATLRGSSEEHMGNYFDMADNGLFLAVGRRGSDGQSYVDVLSTLPNNVQVGNSVRICDGPLSDTSISIAQAFDLEQQRNAYHLITACDSSDGYRGFVQSHTYHPQERGWKLRGSRLQGQHSGARFGSQVVFAEAPSSLHQTQRAFRIAVSAPGFDGQRGMIQVFDFVNGEWFQFGSAIVGHAPGEQLGQFMDMSNTADPYIVASSIQRSDQGMRRNDYNNTEANTNTSSNTARGASSLQAASPSDLRVFHWMKAHFDAPSGWSLIFETVVTSDEGFGPARSIVQQVVMTDEGNRIVALATSPPSQKTTSHPRQVFVYDRFDQQQWMHGPQMMITSSASAAPVVSSYVRSRTTNHRSTQLSLSLNPSGSVIAIGSEPPSNDQHKRARVSLYLDHSGYCSVPTSSDNQHGSTAIVKEAFDRRQCREHGIVSIASPAQCVQTQVFHSGDYQSCVWKGSATLHEVVPPISSAPSTSPPSTSGASLRRSSVPSNAPTSNPTVQVTRFDMTTTNPPDQPATPAPTSTATTPPLYTGTKQGEDDPGRGALFYIFLILIGLVVLGLVMMSILSADASEKQAAAPARSSKTVE